MSQIAFEVSTSLLMMLMLRCAVELDETRAARRYPIPWVAVALTLAAVAGLVTQVVWPGAMAALDHDPSRSGWWRPVTSVFLQNGGVVGDAFNLVALALVAAFAQWWWGAATTMALFVAGVLLPEAIGTALGGTGSEDPRNVVGSSGATYFLAATLAAALALTEGARGRRVLALVVPALGLCAWFTQSNAHGLVVAEGFALGLVVCSVRRLAGVCVAPGHLARPRRSQVSGSDAEGRPAASTMPSRLVPRYFAGARQRARSASGRLLRR